LSAFADIGVGCVPRQQLGVLATSHGATVSACISDTDTHDPLGTVALSATQEQVPSSSPSLLVRLPPNPAVGSVARVTAPPLEKLLIAHAAERS
jgi:hypothetical protein